ncbi:hypothetical protein PIB30_027595 [Stylosanthes scabra]|uniref:Ribosomal protein S14 n=1 Tax=Stylosanthes scabra TaxID=79078 RepID=A0ABU6X9J3_9FABA|nr:hypothetical protein [Stylosanthes scabra]
MKRQRRWENLAKANKGIETKQINQDLVFFRMRNLQRNWEMMDKKLKCRTPRQRRRKNLQHIAESEASLNNREQKKIISGMYIPETTSETLLKITTSMKRR